MRVMVWDIRYIRIGTFDDDESCPACQFAHAFPQKADYVHLLAVREQNNDSAPTRYFRTVQLDDGGFVMFCAEETLEALTAEHMGLPQ